jgi:hypothetical protein
MPERKTERPTHRVYAIRKIGAEWSYWAEIGAAWENKDRQGYNLKLNLLPVGEADLVIHEIQNAEEVTNEAPHRSATRKARRQRPPSGGRKRHRQRTRPLARGQAFQSLRCRHLATLGDQSRRPNHRLGLCDLGMGFPEFCTVSLEELAAIRGPFGLGIERDLHFKARTPISVYIRPASKAGIIVEEVEAEDEGR